MKKTGLLVIALLTTVILVGCNNNTTNNNNQGGNEENNNSSVSENVNNNQEEELPTVKIEGQKDFDQLSFRDIKIVEKSETQNLLRATVSNNSSVDFESMVVDIELFDENNQSIGIIGAILPDVPANGNATMETPIAAGVMNTRDIVVRYSGN